MTSPQRPPTPEQSDAAAAAAAAFAAGAGELPPEPAAQADAMSTGYTSQTARSSPATTPGTASAPAYEGPPEPLPFGELVQGLRAELANAVHDRLHLVTLELKQAGLNATMMVLLATVAALMLCSAWFTVLFAVYMACTTNGVPWFVALLIVLVLNVAGAVVIWLRAHALSNAFTFPASLRMLKHMGTPNLAPDRKEPFAR